MIICKQGDVVLLPFPFTDFSTFKQRPAIIISCDKFNRTHQDVLVAAVTSHIAGRLEDTDYALPIADQRNAGLPKPSLVKMDKIVTIDQRLIRKRLGRLNAESFSAMIGRLKNVIGTALR